MNNDTRDDDLQRDPRLAQLLAAASREEPPAALDAAILAAARREAGAHLRVAAAAAAAPGGGGETGTPPVRAKRNWYVPVSVAAVMVLSISLVITLHQEKGDELSQPPTVARQMPRAPVPATATEPAAASAPKDDGALKDAAPVQPKAVEEKRSAEGEAAKRATTANRAGAPDGYTAMTQPQRKEKAESAPDNAAATGGARRDASPFGSLSRQQPETEAVGRVQERARSAETTADAVARPAPVEAKPAPEPFPAMRDRAAAPGVAASQGPEARTRAESDRSVSGGASGALREAPASTPVPSPPAAPAAAPPPRAAAATRRAAPAEDMQAQSAPAAAPPPPPAVVEAKPAPIRPLQAKAPVWRGLEDQPPEKWLERLAEFKRDNRQTDADALLAEFRRRFPDHPASAR